MVDHLKSGHVRILDPTVYSMLLFFQLSVSEDSTVETTAETYSAESGQQNSGNTTAQNSGNTTAQNSGNSTAQWTEYVMPPTKQIPGYFTTAPLQNCDVPPDKSIPIRTSSQLKNSPGLNPTQREHHPPKVCVIRKQSYFTDMDLNRFMHNTGSNLTQGYFTANQITSSSHRNDSNQTQGYFTANKVVHHITGSNQTQGYFTANQITGSNQKDSSFHRGLPPSVEKSKSPESDRVRISPPALDKKRAKDSGLTVTSSGLSSFVIQIG